MISYVYLFLLFVIVVECRNIKPKQSEIENLKVTGYETINKINFTPCIDKDCVTEKETSKLSESHRRKHHRGKQGRGGKHSRHLPTSKGLTLQGEDPSTSVLNHDWYMDSKVSSRVSRLENKLHQNIRHAAKEFMDNLQSVLRKIQNKIRTVDNEYINIGTTSRKAMMDVREELELITEENNNVYDALLDVSQLVRYVYRRAHENGLGEPVSMALQSYPQLQIMNIENDIRKSQLAYRNASNTYSHVMNLKRRGVQQDAAKSDVMNRVKDKTLSEKFRYYEMYDLQQKVRLILLKVDTLSKNIFIPLQRRLMTYKTLQNNVSERMKHAKYLNGLAYESTKRARNTFQINKNYHERYEKQKRSNTLEGEVRRRRSTVYALLEVLVQRATRKSKQLEEMSSVVYRKLLPILAKSEIVIKEQESADANLLSQTSNILTKLTATMSKLEENMDELRIFMNDSRILEARCAEIDGIHSIIDCHKYGIYEGSGSGDDITDDEDNLFTMKSTTILPKHTKTSTKPSVTSQPPTTKNIIHSMSSAITSQITTIPMTPSPSTSPTEKEQKTSTLSPKTTTQMPTMTATTSSPYTETTTSAKLISITTRLKTDQPSTSKILISSTSVDEITNSSTTAILSTGKPTSDVPTTTPSTSKVTKTPAPSTSEPTQTEKTTKPTPPTSKLTTISTGKSTTSIGKTTTMTSTSKLTTSKPSTATSKPTTTALKTTIHPFEKTSHTITTTIEGIVEGTDGLTDSIEGSGDQVTDTTVDSSKNNDNDFVFDVTTQMRTTTERNVEDGSGESGNEFTFEEEKKKESEEESSVWWPWGDDPNVLYDSHLDFKEKLSNQVYNARMKSEEVYDQWLNISTLYKDMMNRWNGLNDNLKRLGTFVYAANGLKVSWNTEEPMIDRLIKAVPTKSLNIITSVENAENRSQNALNIINEKLAKMLQLKQKRLLRKDDNDLGPAFVAELISTVETVRQNSKALDKLQQINPSPCNDVQSTATRLRSSIAHLRSMINKAKTITSSIPMTISLNGKEVVNASVTQHEVTVSPSTLIEMCVKPNTENMQIATFYGNSTQYYSLYLNDLKPVVVVDREDGTSLGEILFDSTLIKDEWSSISILRNGRTIEMRLGKLNDTTAEIVEDSYLPDISAVHYPITNAVIGGIKESSDYSLFSGCIGEVMVNGRYLVFHKYKEAIKHCSFGCDYKDWKSIVFEGEGFAKFSIHLIDVSYIDNINLHFQTMQKEGILLFINDKFKSLQIVITLSEGALYIEVQTRRGTTVLRSSKDTYNDGIDHMLKIAFGSDSIDVKTDISDDKFMQELARQEITSRLDDGIYLGGLDVQSHSLSGKTKLRSFTGCISSLSISNKEIPLYMIEASHNVYYGKCSENIWQKCVQFNEHSKPMKYLKTEDPRKVNVIFGRDSIGTLLDYKRINGEDFDVTFFVDSTGVEISDNKEKTEYKVISTEPVRDWFVLSVEDNGTDKLLVSLGTSFIEVPYDIPWRFFRKDLSYDLSVGGLVDSDTVTFQGGISTLIINDRPIDLRAARKSYKLMICERSATSRHESLKEDKPVC